jgi:hypothetical protein
MDPDTVPPALFRKTSHSITGPTGDIIRPDGVEFLDYEVELGLVIGRDLPVGTTVTGADLPRYVAGLVVADDVSARQIQLTRTQFYESKSVLCLAGGKQVRLDDVLDGTPAMLTAARPEPGLVDACRRNGISLVRVAGVQPQPAHAGCIDAPGRSTGLQALVGDPSLMVLVRPDRVIAAIGTRSQPPRLPWTTTP